MSKTWIDAEDVPYHENLAWAVGGDALLLSLLARRGQGDMTTVIPFLFPDQYHPADPFDLPDMDKAVDRVRQAIEQGERILIWGDFDVDGQTSTALLVQGLRELGATVDYHIPNRFREGHGIHLETLKTLLEGVGLLLTCDTGVAAHESIAYAQAQGVDVVVTDHHSLPETLPGAVAVVNPMRLPDGHAMREHSGVGVAYQLMRALYGKQKSDHLLDLVAVGLVADVMVLVDDTRYWLQRGLDVLRQAERPGLRALMERAEIDPANVNEEDIGFSIAPRLNALGRLADANPAVELLTSDDPALIAERANELEGLNQERRHLTRQVYAAAQAQIEADPSLLKYAALVLSYPGWHSGVVGIVASRLAEEYQRPVVLLSIENGQASGSARSVAGCNIVEAIATQADMLDGYGGHTMAAGLQLPEENIFAFRRGLSAAVRAMLSSVPEDDVLVIDGYLYLNQLTLQKAESLARLAPFGNGNPAPVLATRNLHIVHQRTMGSQGDHLDLRVEDEQGERRQVKWWFGDESALPKGRFDLAYTFKVSHFQGKSEALIQWLAARPAEGESWDDASGTAYEILDYRLHPNPGEALAQVQQDYPDALLWAEDGDLAGKRTRYEIEPTETLIVWSSPPGADEWQAVLDTAQPKRLILFGAQAQPTLKDVLLRVAGMVKYALNHKAGFFTVQELAGATGQREATVQAALELLVAQGTLDLEHITQWGTRTLDPAQIKERLQALYQETAAYRQHWQRQSFGA